MKRREFLQLVGLGLAGSWMTSRLSGPHDALAGGPGLHMALLADAHLRDGDPRRPEAQSLARAVSEIKALKPVPDLILFAGDLAHSGDPRALALGREILSDLPAPPLMVMGEGDGLPEAAGPWRRLFGEPSFSRSFPGLQVLGLHTAWCAGPAGPVFHLGKAGRDRLARELARLDPGVPLLILSHAPLARIFRPWQQWTEDAAEIVPFLSCFRQVLCFHGHVHGSGVKAQWSGVRKIPPDPPLEKGGVGTSPPLLKGDLGGFGDSLMTGKLGEHSIIHQGLPSTAWPWPAAVQGTPAAPRPGLGPRGCGWSRVSLIDHSFQFLPHLWQA